MSTIPNGDHDPLANLFAFETYPDHIVGEQIFWPIINAVTNMNWRKDSRFEDSFNVSRSPKVGVPFEVQLMANHPLGVPFGQEEEYKGIDDLTIATIAVTQIVTGPYRQKILENFEKQFVDVYDRETFDLFDPELHLIPKTETWIFFNSLGHSEVDECSKVDFKLEEVDEEEFEDVIAEYDKEGAFILEGSSSTEPKGEETDDEDIEQDEGEDPEYDAYTEAQKHGIFFARQIEMLDYAAKGLGVAFAVDRAIKRLLAGEHQS